MTNYKHAAGMGGGGVTDYSFLPLDYTKFGGPDLSGVLATKATCAAGVVTLGSCSSFKMVWLTFTWRY